MDSSPLPYLSSRKADTRSRDQRIFSTGCAGTHAQNRNCPTKPETDEGVRVDENTTLNDCFREKKDWRACKDEVCISFLSLRLWGLDERTEEVSNVSSAKPTM